MLQMLIYVGTDVFEVAFAWLICGICALLLLRLVQARDPTTVVTEADVSGALWWGFFSLIAITVIIGCRIIHPIIHIPGWVGRMLGLSVTSASYSEKGFFAKYLE